MAVIPENQATTAAAIFKLHKDKAAAKPHLKKYIAAGTLGHVCSRYTWFQFRSVLTVSIEPRILRLFETGHIEEARVLAELRRLPNIEIYTHAYDGSGKQIAVEYANGHGKGYLDAVARGLPEAPATWHVIDVKTVGAKRLSFLNKCMGESPTPGEALRKFSPQYYGQGMLYMGMQNITRALFLFVCKDSDSIVGLRYEYDKSEFEKLMRRADETLNANEPPPPISFDALDWRCKFCDYQAVCHGTAAPRAHCRTCAHSTPTAGGQWHCSHFGKAIPFEASLADGQCPEHRYIPRLLEQFGDYVGAVPDANGNQTVEYRSRMHGEKVVRFYNGPAPAGYPSKEIHAAADKRVLGNTDDQAGAGIQELREQFGGEIVG